jgi:hypothetical protein
MQQHGGSRAWVLNPKRARGCSYVVCAWNPAGEHAEGSGGRQHGVAYLVAPIASIEPAPPPEDPKRFIIRFNMFAEISKTNAWNHQRNPVFYTTLQDLGIDLNELTFSAMPTQAAPSTSRIPDAAFTRSDGIVAPLTIAAAKRGLAAHYGIDPTGIEIIIRG